MAEAAPKPRGGWLVPTRTLVLGALGGGLAYLAGVPLGWLLGAMAASIALAMAGVDMRAPRLPRRLMVAVIGLMVGANFTPDVLARMPMWWPSLLGVCLFTVLTAASGFLLCWRLGKLAPATAAFAGMPGGISELLVVGPALGADIRSLSLIHGTRLVALIAIVPTALSLAGLVASGASAGARSMDWAMHLSPADAAILLACGAVGMVLGRRLRLPAADLTGPLLLSAIVHLSGLTAAHIPDLLIALAQMVIGASIGQYFAGIERRFLMIGLALGLLLTAVALTLATLFAWAFSVFFGVEFAIGLLALAPGGFPEMSLIAVSLGTDPAFVGAHHLTRVVLILVTAPILVPALVRHLEARDVANN